MKNLKRNAKKEITAKIFDALIKCAKVETGNDIGTVGMGATFINYSIGFYASSDDNYKVIVEDFGMMKKGDWIQLEPTENQLAEMQKIILNKVEGIRLSNQESEERFDDSFDGDYYNLYGVSKSMFY